MHAATLNICPRCKLRPKHRGWSSCRDCNARISNAYYHSHPDLRRKMSVLSLRRYHDGKDRYSRAKQSAKANGLSFSIGKDEWRGLVEAPCHYCKMPSEYWSGTGLDRIDNARGYEQDNVVSCCPTCNKVRGDWFTVEEMELFIGPAIRHVKLERKSSPVRVRAGIE